MATAPAALKRVPPTDLPAATLAALQSGAAIDVEAAREAAAGCQACDLWARATQPSSGPGRSRRA
jgi:hypothetical protein